MSEETTIGTPAPESTDKPDLRRTAEEKRMAARRRFLKGGAAALPVIVTLGQTQAWAASSQVCASMGVTEFGVGLTEEEKALVQAGLMDSLYCRP